ncbi:MAG: hypothetical protein K6F82_03440 [Sphaerochaetaceae bacterium]|nr:hypothetical protein [Sphaerochaetaceae bacterium]
MKRLILTVFIIFLCFSAFAFSMDVAADAFVLKDFVMRGTDCQGSADARIPLDSDFQIRVPVRVTYKTGRVCVESSLNVAYYPFSKGLFFSLSMVDMAYLYNISNKTATLYTLNEIEAGWTFPVAEKFFIEPSVCIRDPSGTFSAEYGELKGIFSSYSRIRIRLCCGYHLFKED